MSAVTLFPSTTVSVSEQYGGVDITGIECVTSVVFTVVVVSAFVVVVVVEVDEVIVVSSCTQPTKRTNNTSPIKTHLLFMFT